MNNTPTLFLYLLKVTDPRFKILYNTLPPVLESRLLLVWPAPLTFAVLPSTVDLEDVKSRKIFWEITLPASELIIFDASVFALGAHVDSSCSQSRLHLFICLLSSCFVSWLPQSLTGHFVRSSRWALVLTRTACTYISFIQFDYGIWH